MINFDWNSILKEEKVIWSFSGNGPHAKFVFGERHSGEYFNSDILFAKPHLLDKIADYFFEYLSFCQFDLGGIIAKAPYSTKLACPLAQRLNIPLIKFHEDAISDLDNVLIFTDDIYSGGLVKEIIKDLEEKKINIVCPICVIANYSGDNYLEGREIFSIVKSEFRATAWESGDCPLCKDGSNAVNVRDNWELLTK